jgi:hypothetical protein
MAFSELAPPFEMQCSGHEVREQRHSTQVHSIHQKQALNLNEPVHINQKRKTT